MSTMREDLCRIGYPVEREMTLRRLAQAIVPPASSTDLERMIHNVCRRADEVLNGAGGEPADPAGALDLMIGADELIAMSEMEAQGIHRG